MTEGGGYVRRGSGLPRGPVESLSPRAWQRVEAGVFARLDAAAAPWSLASAPPHSYAAPSADGSLRLHWAASVGLALASAAAAASMLHWLRPAPRIEAGTPAELVMPAEPAASRAEPGAPRVEPARDDAARDGATPDDAAGEAAPDEAAQPPSDSARVLPRAPLGPFVPAPGIDATPRAPVLLPRAPLGPFVPAPATRSGARRGHPERAPARSDRERLFDRATRLESANAPLALALYLSLASGDDGWAANALYAAARLEIDHGLRGEGAAHLAEYLARFPQGENVVDVRGLRQRIGVPSH